MNIEYKRTTYQNASLVEKAQLLVLLRELWFYESFIIYKRVLTYDDKHLNAFLLNVLKEATCVVMATSSGTPVGFVMGSVDTDIPDDFHISIIAVNEAYRSKGIGKKLLSFIKSVCKTKTISLGTLEDNTSARRFYEANGFVFNEPPYKVNKAFNVRGVLTV